MIDPGVKVGVTVVLVKNRKVLLGLRGYEVETAKNTYAFPGGRMDYGENSPEDALVREIFEETGLKIKKNKLTFFRPVSEFFPNEKKHYVSLVYIYHLSEDEGDPKPVEGKGKCLGWEWFGENEIPENTFIHTKESIKRYFMAGE